MTFLFHLGVVFDVGVKNLRLALLPSSSLEGVRPSPLVITQLEMPAWKIGLCIPSDISPQTEEQEIAFFKRACPTSAVAASETLYHVVLGVVAAARDRDFRTFCDAVNAIQRCTWKRLERELYAESLLLVEREIYDNGASAVGMSSLGPGLFFLADDVDAVTARVRRVLPQYGWIVGICHNSGRTVTHQ